MCVCARALLMLAGLLSHRKEGKHFICVAFYLCSIIIYFCLLHPGPFPEEFKAGYRGSMLKLQLRFCSAPFRHGSPGRDSFCPDNNTGWWVMPKENK